MNEEMLDLDAAYAVDDDMQEEIDKLKADPWALLPAKDGFTPIDLSPDAPDGSAAHAEGYRERWTQTEVVEIVEAGMRALTNRDNKEVIEGQIAFVTYKCVRGPNADKRIDQSWWLRNNDRPAVRDMNANLQEMFGKLKLTPTLIKLEDGREVPSFTASLPQLKGKTVAMTMQQKWDYPYTQLPDGSWEAQTEEPKKFKKRIFGIKAI